MLRLCWVCVGVVFCLLCVNRGPAPVVAGPAAQQGAWRTYANGDDIWALALEGSNVLWAGTRGGGAVRWDLTNPSSPTAHQYLFPQDGLAGNFVRALVVDSQGRKWFATDRGLSRLTPAGAWQTYTRASTGGKLASNTVTALAVQGNTLWVGTQQVWSTADRKWIGGGLARVDIGVEPPVWRDAWSADADPTRLPSNNVTDLAVDPTNGDVWVTTRTDLENIVPSPTRPNTFFRARYGGIAVVHADLTGHKFQRDAYSPAVWPKSDSFLTVAVDARGVKWFGSGDLTQGGVGIHLLKGNTAANAQWKGYAAPGPILPPGVALISSLPRGANRIPNISIGAAGQVWVSLAGVDTDVDHGEGLGLCLLSWSGEFDAPGAPTCATYDTSGGTTNQRLPGNLVRALVVDAANQRALVGTGGRLPDADRAAYSEGTDGHGIGLLTFGPPNTTTLSTAALGLTPSSNHISAVAVRQDGTIWVGNAYPTGSEAWGGRGLDILVADRWLHEPIGTNSSQAVSSITFDSRARPWVGLFKQPGPTGFLLDGGVAVDADGWTVYTATHGLPSNSVSVVAADGARVWVGTGSRWPDPHSDPDVSAGLVHFDTATEAWGAAVKSPTILGNDITALATRDGQTWVANTWPAQPGADKLPGGLSLFSNGGWSNYPANEAGLRLTANDPRAVHLAPDGTLWAGGYQSDRPLPDPVLSNAVVNWRPVGVTQWQSRTFVDEGWVSAIQSRGDGSVWVGLSRGGQNVEDFPAKVFPAGQGNQYRAVGGLRVYVNGEWRAFVPDTSPLISSHINALAIDAQDNVWIATGMGLMRYSGNAPSDPRPFRVWLPHVWRGD